VNGILVERGNPNDIAEKCLMLLKDEDLRIKMGQTGREKAKNYTWDKIGKQTFEVYQQVISEFRRS
jgi:glycosyltransferase involved in cell wall biosynthesis